MLEVQTRHTMPVDFAAYLLSSSPPGFEMYNANMVRAHMMTSTNTTGSFHRRTQSDCDFTRLPRPIITKRNYLEPGIVQSQSAPELSSLQSDSESDISSDNSTPLASPTTDCDDPIFLGSPTVKKKSGKKKGMGKKKVSFADDLGLALAKVKILTESPDTPPRLRREILESVTQGAIASVSEDPPMVLNFSQPASDYLAFREKIDKNCVSLENVILKDYNLMGTIKVKNIGFEKSVKVRVTYDRWNSHFDVSSLFLPNNYSAGQSNLFDTFSFEFSIPTDLDIKNTVQFAICYEACGKQFWDNNDGVNYEVVSKDWKNEPKLEESPSSDPSHPPIFKLNFKPQWTSFSSWTHSDADVPYW